MLRVGLKGLYLRFYTGEVFNLAFAEISYPINDSPKAVVRIPLGRLFYVDGTLGNYPKSEGYELIENFWRYRFNIGEIYIHLEHSQTEDEELIKKPVGMPESGLYMLFRGFISDLGVSVSTSDFPYIEIHMSHFLEFLRGSSLLNSVTHASNPTVYTYDPTLSFGGAGTAFNLSASGSLFAAVEEWFHNAPVPMDFWTGAVYPIFVVILQSAVLNARLLENYLGIDYQNSPRYPGDSDAPIQGLLSLWTLNQFDPEEPQVPMWYVDPHTTDLMIDFLIEYVFRSEAFEENATTTLWDKMLEIANAFMVAVIPFPDHYEVHPFCLGLIEPYAPYTVELPETGEIVETTFTADSILNIAISRREPTFNTRCVCVLADYDTLAGSQLNNGVIQGYEELAGAYCSVETSTGQIIFVPSLPYLKHVVFEERSTELLQEMEETQESTTTTTTTTTPQPGEGGGGDNGDPERTTTTTTGEPQQLPSFPSARRPETVSEESVEEIDEYIRELLNPLNRYAQYVFILNQIGRRALKMVTAFRTDVCPGSTVRIDVHDPAFFEDGKATFLLGTVREVRYVIDATEGPYTVYEILGWRTKYEEIHPDFSIPWHPLYGLFFLGKPHILKELDYDV